MTSSFSEILITIILSVSFALFVYIAPRERRESQYDVLPQPSEDSVEAVADGSKEHNHLAETTENGSKHNNLIETVESSSTQHDDCSSEPLEETPYRPLLSKTHIRLIVLEGGAASHLHATLKVVDLAEDPIYEALSYVWGTPRFIDKHILINGHKVPIRDNLWTALQKIRLQDKPKILWIDALSIYQEDNNEKAKQVALIGNIFKQAQRVLVWMGEHERHSERLFMPWPEIPSAKTKLNYESPSEIKPEMKVEKRKMLWHKFKRKRPDAVDNFQSGSALDELEAIAELRHTKREIWSAFLKREYWSRRWIIQETILAKEIVVHCGEDKMDWHSLIEARHALPKFDTGLLGSLDGIDFDYNTANPLFFRLVNLRKEKVRGYPLLDLMSEFQMSRCTDQRDKVYAFLALDSGQKLVEPDYTISIETLFIRVLVANMLQLGLLGEQTEDTRKMGDALVRVMFRVFELTDAQKQFIIREMNQMATTRFQAPKATSANLPT